MDTGIPRGVPVVRFGPRTFRLHLTQVTTGPPLYLVSACGSAEEFVAAFRRYADRTGLFVPMAAPLPAGKRGRLALTLKDGGVMIEGEAEILQSSTKPTVLHGRPGMTVKFVEPDDLSKVVIGELEKARLALRPAPPTVPARPAAVPAEPRPVPPAPSGRIDAANSLAECVVIGDVASLTDVANAPRSFGIADRPGAKFVVPAIPAMGGPRAKSPSAAPGLAPAPKLDAAAETTKVGTAAPPNLTAPLAAQTPASEAASDVAADVVADAATDARTASTSPVSDEPTASTPPIDGPPKKTTDPTIPAQPLEPLLDVEDEATAFGAIPTKKPTDPALATVAPPVPRPPTPTPAPTASTPPTPPGPSDASAVRRSELIKNHKATSIGFPALRTPFQTQQLGVVPSRSALDLRDVAREPAPPTLPKSSPRGPAPGPRGKTPTTPPLTPRHPTPVAPVPIVRSPAKSAPVVPDEEQTDLGATAAAAPSETEATAESGAIPTPPPAQRSGGMRASEILAAIPAGDWTMTPDESVPHPLPAEARAPAPVVHEPTPAPAPPPVPKKAPTGDWTISLDPAKRSWSEPEKRGRGEPPTKGNPVVAIASEKPINVVEWEEKPTGIGELKIEIDSTLMEASTSSPRAGGTGSESVLGAATPHTALPGTTRTDTQPPPLGPTPAAPAPASARPVAPPHFTQPPRAASPYPIAPPGFAGGTTAVRDRGRTKMIALAISAGALAIGAIVVLVLTLSGKDKAAAKATHDSGSAAAPVALPAPPSADAAASDQVPALATEQVQKPAVEQPAHDEADEATAEPTDEPSQPPAPVADTPPAAPTTCSVQLASVPKGADVYIDGKKLGTTPGTFELPCGTQEKLSLRKSRFANTIKSFTPLAGKPNKLTVRLRRDLFQVKVTSTPAGATITARGRQLGVTPTTIKLPAYDTTSITLTKSGYTTETSRVTPRSNNGSHHVTLKKGRARR